MPELPEVESVACNLKAAGIVGRTITSARVLWKRSVATPSPAEFVQQITGLQIQDASRRGKFIVIPLSRVVAGLGEAGLPRATPAATVLVHLRMSGRMNLGKGIRSPYDRVVLTLDDGRELSFTDTRKFGRVWLLANADKVLGKLGPEPLSLSTTGLWSLVNGHSRLLKPLLLDQTVIAGIGNIYADEALWDARLHPLRKSNTLTRKEATRLLRAIKTVLRRGIRNLGTTLGRGQTNFTLPDGERGENAEDLRTYGRTGLPCPRCRTPIRRIIVGQRSTHLCPACQRRRR